ncbi:hypothetical protein UPYG_G00066600 [Umbra pygmaea]|uniref:IF rod domain-containing protein n=1 Tax=Umbra pygmaea TaxID=75934 RepID=A0ABD0XAK1_UMBPY
MSLISSSYSSTRALSMYGGAGGYGSHISSSRGGLDKANGLDLHVSANEKATMQNLNDRLASYLEKVRLLEKENSELEKKIKNWYSLHKVVSHDHSAYFATIDDLRKKIHLGSTANVRTLLNIDNARLAAEDFKIKYETELAMTAALEADIYGLRNGLDNMNLNRFDLEKQYEGLKEELIMLKRNHEEELALVKIQAGGQVNVCVDAAPSQDLNEAMTEIRQHYESVAAKNRNEIEAWYQGKLATVEIEIVTSNEQLTSSVTELKQTKSTLQRLQIELQSHLSMLYLSPSTEILPGRHPGRHPEPLFWSAVGAPEHGDQPGVPALPATRADIFHNKQEYDILLDIKTRLETEIAEYRRLLDGENHHSTTKVVTKTVTVVETIVDGKVTKTSKAVDVAELES